MNDKIKNGKGSRKRARQVSRKEFEQNWDEIFSKKKPRIKHEHDQRGWQPK